MIIQIKNIFQYDISQKELSIITKYPTGFMPKKHSITINKDNGDMYILNGQHNVFGIFNLENLKWNVVIM